MFYKENNQNLLGINTDSIRVILVHRGNNAFSFSAFVALQGFFYDLFVMTYSMCDRCPMLAAIK